MTKTRMYGWNRDGNRNKNRHSFIRGKKAGDHPAGRGAQEGIQPVETETHSAPDNDGILGNIFPPFGARTCH